MITCPTCGTQLEDGVKFCSECGTPIPQTKKCIKCGFELTLSAKFCPECGTKQDGSSAPASGSGFSMGDKNVIAGDVIGHKEETHIAGNATIIKNEDQTKQVKKCHICGSLVPIVEGFDCKECGQFTCTSCFDEKNGVCKDCADTIEKRNEEEYKNTLKMALADGRIEFSERNQLITLQQKLNISQEKAAILEQQLKGDSSENFTTVEKLNIDKAYNLFYREEKATEAFEIIKPIFNNHQNDEKILNIYIPLLAQTDEEQALNFINSMQVDILMAYITAIDIALQNDDLDEAERKYKQAARIWPENALVKCYLVLLNYALYKKFNQQDFLNKAKELVENLGEAQNELELSMQVRVQMFMQEVSGETVPEITKQFCEDNQLYYGIMQKQFITKKEQEHKARELEDYSEEEKQEVLKRYYENGLRIIKQAEIGDKATIVCGFRKFAKSYTFPIKKIGTNTIQIEYTEENTPNGTIGNRYPSIAQIISITKKNGKVIQSGNELNAFKKNLTQDDLKKLNI